MVVQRYAVLLVRVLLKFIIIIITVINKKAGSMTVLE